MLLATLNLLSLKISIILFHMTIRAFVEKKNSSIRLLDKILKKSRYYTRNLRQHQFQSQHIKSLKKDKNLTNKKCIAFHSVFLQTKKIMLILMKHNTTIGTEILKLA